VEEAVHAQLLSQSKTFSSEGIHKLVVQWTKYIEKKGGYVKKMILLYRLK
jgi:hypothetical protein